jgi:hypothetical protein
MYFVLNIQKMMMNSYEINHILLNSNNINKITKDFKLFNFKKFVKNSISSLPPISQTNIINFIHDISKYIKFLKIQLDIFFKIFFVNRLLFNIKTLI